MTEDEFIQELKDLVSQASCYLSRYEGVREVALRKVREIVKLASRAVLEAERDDLRESEKLIEQGCTLLSEVKEATREFADLVRYVRDGERELFEAILTYKFIAGRGPRVQLTEISHSAKISALFDFAGELKRIFYSSLLAGKVRDAERALKCAEEIYCSLTESDVTNASVHDFKFRLDNLRRQIEGLKRDLLFYKAEK